MSELTVETPRRRGRHRPLPARLHQRPHRAPVRERDPEGDRAAAVQDRRQLRGPHLHRERGPGRDDGRDRGDPGQRGRPPAGRAQRDGRTTSSRSWGSTTCTGPTPPRRRPSRASAKAGRPRPDAGEPRPARRRRAKPALVVKIPSETAYLALVRELTKKMAEAAGFPEATADRARPGRGRGDHQRHRARLQGRRRPGGRAALRGPGRRSSGSRSSTPGRWSTRGRCPGWTSSGSSPSAAPAAWACTSWRRSWTRCTFRRSARRNVCLLVKRKDAAAAP